MNEREYKYKTIVENTIKEWEYLRTQFKNNSDTVKHIDEIIIKLKKLALLILLNKKEKL